MNKYDLAIAFLSVADAGSLQKAAKQLHQTEAAISRKLSKLEDYLGAQLLWRHRSGAQLTELGQRYYHQAKLALQQFKQAELLVQNQVRKPSGVLNVVANAFYAHQLILPKLQTFLETYPDIELKLDIAEVLPTFHKKSMDILFGINLKSYDDLMKKPIDIMRYTLCASTDYLNKHEAIKLPATLLQQDFIVHSTRENPDVITLDNEQTIYIKPKLWLNHSASIIEAAKQGLGIIWIPHAFVKHELEKGALVEILKSYTQQTYPVYMYYRDERYMASKIRAFVDFFNRVGGSEDPS